MYDMNNYDNDIAYGYDDYIESKENEDIEDYLIDRAITDALEYESAMGQQMIDSLYNNEN